MSHFLGTGYRDDAGTDDLMLKLFRDLGIGLVVVELWNTRTQVTLSYHRGCEERSRAWGHVLQTRRGWIQCGLPLCFTPAALARMIATLHSDNGQ